MFNDVEVPVANRLGEEGEGLRLVMSLLPQERLSIGATAVAYAELYLDWTIEYRRERTAFGTSIGSLQNTKFVLAELATQIESARVFVDRCVELLVEKRLDTETASMVKLLGTELRKRVVDECVQLHGGYGYMLEYPIARGYIDSRVETV